jgi:glycerate dehydrogenase
MRIVVLDGLTLNPGDLSWKELESLGPCQIHDRTASAELLARAANAQVLLTNKTPLNAKDINALSLLKYIGVLATGTNIVDTAAARDRGVVVTNVPAYGTGSVAQATIALLLELTNHVGHHAQTVRDGRWSKSPDWCYWEYPLTELEGLTMGIVGFGRIGKAVGRVATALGMVVTANITENRPLPGWVKAVDLETTFRCSDVVSLHCPLTPRTVKLVNAQRLAWMKPGALLLNTSRGALVDEPALAEALNTGRLGGAGLDVLSTEPPPAHHPLLHAKNCVVTPHQAWGTRAARSRLMRTAVENVRAFLQGTPQNVVN